MERERARHLLANHSTGTCARPHRAGGRGRAVVTGCDYYALPSYTRVGYTPEQAGPFSHELHAGKLGMDCAYCHQVGVRVAARERADIADVHELSQPKKANVKGTSPLLAPVRTSFDTGRPVEWKKVHKRPSTRT